MTLAVQPVGPLYQAAITAISTDRFGPYLRKAKGDSHGALDLYHWNMRASAAIYETLHIVEVALRNTIDQQLRVWNQTQRNLHGDPRSADWLLDPAPILEKLVKRDKIDDAIDRATNHIQRRRRGSSPVTPAHCDVLAQLTFGTWRFLLKAPTGRKPDSKSVLLWAKVLPHAFPAMTRTPQELVSDVIVIYEARNRIAHLEPMLNSRLVQQIRDAAHRILADIGGMLPYWFDSQEMITDVLKKHPTDPIPKSSPQPRS